MCARRADIAHTYTRAGMSLLFKAYHCAAVWRESFIRECYVWVRAWLWLDFFCASEADADVVAVAFGGDGGAYEQMEVAVKRMRMPGCHDAKVTMTPGCFDEVRNMPVSGSVMPPSTL